MAVQYMLGETLINYSLIFLFFFYGSQLSCNERKMIKLLLNCSDKPGNHDFKVLNKLVLPDGSILRARYAGRPTRDCLFKDPVMDGKR